MRSPIARNFVSCSPARTNTGTVDLAEPLPQRFLGARARGSQARRQAAGGVAEPVVAQCGLLREPGEEGVAEPFVDEGVDADRFDVVSEELVGCPASQALVEVVDPGGGADQYERSHPLGVCDRCVQRHPTPHRVADVGGRTAGIDESMGALPRDRSRAVGERRRGRADRPRWSPRRGAAR